MDVVSGCQFHCFLLQNSTLPLNKKGMSLHATCNSCMQHFSSVYLTCNSCMQHFASVYCTCNLCMQHFRNWIASKQLNQYNASVINVLWLVSSYCTCLLDPLCCWHMHPCTLQLRSTLIRAPLSDTVTLISCPHDIWLHQSNWSGYYYTVGSS